MRDWGCGGTAQIGGRIQNGESPSGSGIESLERPVTGWRMGVAVQLGQVAILEVDVECPERVHIRF